jgi:redox-sensitive bicupin YhaK (pirin superfamily)
MKCSLDIAKGTQVLIFGGKPLAKEPLLLWNFVSSDKERLKQAKQDWIDREFPVVPRDSTYIPFPNT